MTRIRSKAFKSEGMQSPSHKTKPVKATVLHQIILQTTRTMDNYYYHQQQHDDAYTSPDNHNRDFMMQQASAVASTRSSLHSPTGRPSTTSIEERMESFRLAAGSNRHMLDLIVSEIPEETDDFTIPTSKEAYNSYGRKSDNKRRHSRRYDGKRVSKSRSSGGQGNAGMSYSASRLLHDFCD